MSDPTIPPGWRAVRTGEFEDQYGRRSMSGRMMPRNGGPMYDPGGWGGQELPGMSRRPLVELFMGNDPMTEYLLLRQLNGRHPTQLNQQQWENALGRALMSGGYKK